jgi:hypothetical protein
MCNPRTQANNGKAKTLKALDALDQQMIQMCIKAEVGKFPGLADLKRAQRRVRKIRSELCTTDRHEKYDWKSMLQVIGYIAKIVKDLFFT